jgi:hypothetical protein
MGRTVAELQSVLSSAELTEWMAYSLVEPFGQPRADDAARLLASLAVNAASSSGQPATPADFLKTWEPPVEDDDVASKLLGWFDRYDEMREAS